MGNIANSCGSLRNAWQPWCKNRDSESRGSIPPLCQTTRPNHLPVSSLPPRTPYPDSPTSSTITSGLYRLVYLLPFCCMWWCWVISVAAGNLTETSAVPPAGARWSESSEALRVLPHKHGGAVAPSSDNGYLAYSITSKCDHTYWLGTVYYIWQRIM